MGDILPIQRTQRGREGPEGAPERAGGAVPAVEIILRAIVDPLGGPGVPGVAPEAVALLACQFPCDVLLNPLTNALKEHIKEHIKERREEEGKVGPDTDTV